MMIKALPQTRMMLAETCTSKLARIFFLYQKIRLFCPDSCCWAFFFLTCLLFLLHCSALVQFFQLFSEFQPNEFYATGEVSGKAALFFSHPLNHSDNRVHSMLQAITWVASLLVFNIMRNIQYFFFLPQDNSSQNHFLCGAVLCREVCSSDWLLHPQE